MWAPLGNSVHQFLGVVTLAYYLRLMCMIHRQKDMFKEYIHKQQISSPKQTHIFPTIRCRKNAFRASKRLRKFRAQKLPKIVNCATIKETGKIKEKMVGVQVEQVGGHQYPPGSYFFYDQQAIDAPRITKFYQTCYLQFFTPQAYFNTSISCLFILFLI